MMEQSQDNSLAAVAVANDGQTAVAAAPVSVGRQLKEARERLGLSVEDVVNLIKLAPRQVHALEADDFESLPEMAFVRGFVRSYAKALRLEAQPLLDALPGGKSAAPKQGTATVDVPFPIEPSQQTQNMRLLLGALLIALLMTAFAAWQAYGPQPAPADEANPAVQGQLIETPVPLPEQVEVVPGSAIPAVDVMAASAVPQAASAVIAAPVAGVPAVAAPLVANKSVAEAKPAAAVTSAAVAPAAVTPAVKSGKVHLLFDADSWTEVKDKSGKTVAKGLYKAGQELNLDGEAPFSLLVGNASKAHLTYRGKPVDMAAHIGASNDVARLTLE